MASTASMAEHKEDASVLPISLITLRRIMRHAPAAFLTPLNFAMSRYKITSGKRVAAFLSQLAVESNQLRHTHEQWTARENFKLSGVDRPAHSATSKEDYFQYWYGERDDLGNTTAEDGYTYRGRGAIQITGKANYIEVGNAIGKPLDVQPDLLETDAGIDMLASACFFVQVKGLNRVADQVDPSSSVSIRHTNRRLTKAVNGGHNAEAERLGYFEKGLKALVVKAHPLKKNGGEHRPTVIVPLP